MQNHMTKKVFRISKILHFLGVKSEIYQCSNISFPFETKSNRNCDKTSLFCNNVRSKKLKQTFLIDRSRNKKNGPKSSTLMQMTLHFRTEGSLSLDHPVQGASTFISLDRPLSTWDDNSGIKCPLLRFC